MAIEIVEPDGTSRKPCAFDSYSFADAQREVGGYVEALPIVGGYVLVNEEGRIRRMPPNRPASARAGRPLVGTAVFLSGHDIDRVLGPRG